MVVGGVGHAGQAKIADLKIAICVQQKVAGLEVAVQHISGVDVF